ncbi:helix-turn-helix transcriptional regulator [Chryseobacterium echinoideorum]|uniref:helix-turn-helix transcriptional regulator n=1 Tax=Chryseobacterium echinoideorum TaxID=1549648 RepID=UPI00118486BF|nr:LuxR C-terminal-related transcriptional regulator [Chryseobacterium echinoideorum]
MRKNIFISYIGIAFVTGIIFFFFQKRKSRIKPGRQNTFEANQVLSHYAENFSESVKELFWLAKINDPSFLVKFIKVYPDFCNKIFTLYPNILNSELAFCAYIKLNFSTKEIANYTFVTKKAVQVRKSRLRKKFNIPSNEDLYIWFKKL